MQINSINCILINNINVTRTFSTLEQEYVSGFVSYRDYGIKHDTIETNFSVRFYRNEMSSNDDYDNLLDNLYDSSEIIVFNSYYENILGSEYEPDFRTFKVQKISCNRKNFNFFEINLTLSIKAPLVMCSCDEKTFEDLPVPLTYTNGLTATRSTIVTLNNVSSQSIDNDYSEVPLVFYYDIDTIKSVKKYLSRDVRCGEFDIPSRWNDSKLKLFSGVNFTKLIILPELTETIDKFNLSSLKLTVRGIE